MTKPRGAKRKSNTQHIRGTHGHLLKAACAEGKCKIALPKGNIACVCLNKYKKKYAVTGRLSDCLLYWSAEDERLAVIELKGGTMKASQVIEQLEQGALIARELLGGRKIQIFRPVIALNSMHTMEGRVLKGRKVKFDGRDEYIRFVKCGGDLKDVFGR